MKYLFHPEAEAELVDAIDYYERLEPGLGSDFAIEVHSAIQGILSFPQAWPVLEGGIRRRQTRRFPYGIVYSQITIKNMKQAENDGSAKFSARFLLAFPV